MIKYLRKQPNGGRTYFDLLFNEIHFTTWVPKVRQLVTLCAQSGSRDESYPSDFPLLLSVEPCS